MYGHHIVAGHHDVLPLGAAPAADVPFLAGSAVGSQRGPSATNLQILKPGRVDNVVSTRSGPLPLRLCVSGSVDPVRLAGRA